MKIKRILKYIGIDRMVMTIDPKTRKEVMRPLYEAATTHTARKTFIGNLYKQVKDPNLIASMSTQKKVTPEAPAHPCLLQHYSQ